MLRKPLKGIYLVGLSSLIAAGCQLLSPYKGPVTPTPNHWKIPAEPSSNLPESWKKDLPEKSSSPESPSNSDSPPEGEAQEMQEEFKEPCFDEVCRDLYNWWEVFNDPILNQLEEHALASSYTLWAALERVIEARAQACIHFAPLLPAINFAPSFSRTGSLFQNPLQGFNAGGSSGLPTSDSLSSFASAANNTGNGSALSSFTTAGDFRFVQSQYLVPLNLSYEVDLWGKLNNTYYAALIRSQAASQAYLNVLLSLTGDVASAYFQLRGLDSQQEVIQNNIRVRQDALDISNARYKAGLVLFLDVSRAQVEVARAYSDSANIYRLRGLQENILATLIGVPASIFTLEQRPLRQTPPAIPTGLPSELLCRRPDIAEAERKLAAAHRDIGVAYANFFPSLNLSASYGFESPFSHQLFSWRSRFWEVGFNLFQTIFDAGRNQANYDYYRARFAEAMADYQQNVLNAFKDVEDSLVNLRGYAQQAQDIQEAVKAARVTLKLAKLRYSRGLINYLDVVDAERQLLETEQLSASILGNRYVSTVMLIRALGGGWGPCENCAFEETENDDD